MRTQVGSRAAFFVVFSGFLAACCVLALARPQQDGAAGSASAQRLPVIAIQEVETASPEAYAMMVEQGARVLKEKFGIDHYVRVFVGQAAGQDSGKVFAVITNESFVKMAANSSAFEKEAALLKARSGMDEVRKLGPQVLLKAVRMDGRNDTSFVYNVRMNVTDEIAYLKALDDLRRLMDEHDLKDCKINLYRVVAGRTDYSHLASLNAPAPERMAAVLDAISSAPWATEWIAGAARLRTVVSNGTYREITR